MVGLGYGIDALARAEFLHPQVDNTIRAIRRLVHKPFQYVEQVPVPLQKVKDILNINLHATRMLIRNNTAIILIQHLPQDMPIPTRE